MPESLKLTGDMDEFSFVRDELSGRQDWGAVCKGGGCGVCGNKDDVRASKFEQQSTIATRSVATNNLSAAGRSRATSD